MKKHRNIIFYLITIALFSLLMYEMVNKGNILESFRNYPDTSGEVDIWNHFLISISENLNHSLALLLAQITTIIFVARVFGWLCRRIGQPSVIGEIFAGIALGPSFLGAHFPEFSAGLFPVESLGNLHFLSQIGLILFMFVIGMELDLKVFRKRARDAVVMSHVGIVFPFSLGVGLAYFTYESFAPGGARFLPYSFFLGIAMSITAFPVLARIIQERGIHKTKLGTLIITCAASDDITAWFLLAVVIAIVKAGSFVSALYTIGLTMVYIGLMIYLIRPFIKRVGDLHTSRENLNRSIVAIFFLMLIVSSYATEVIGIHALFGAFVAGAVMPENVKFRDLFIEKIEDIALILLLPLFFVLTGLRTEIGLLDSPEMWMLTGLIIVIAIVGKYTGSTLAARIIGQSWKDSLTIGALVNSRGLMELIVLNIGYDLGVLSPEIFAMFVIMALVTTLMTGPSLDLINYIFRKDISESEIIATPPTNRFNILLSFANPANVRSLLRVAHNLVGREEEGTAITAMHLSPSSELHHYNIDQYEAECFRPVVSESKKLNRKITTLFKASADVEGDIAAIVNHGNYDFLLMGIGKSIYEGTVLGRILGFTTKIINPDAIISQVTGKESHLENIPFDSRTRQIISRSNISVGILIERDLKEVKRVLIAMYSPDEAYILDYAIKLKVNANSNVDIVQMSDDEIVRNANGVGQSDKTGSYFSEVSRTSINKEYLDSLDLLLTSTDGWRELVASENGWFEHLPSTLVITNR